MTLERSGEAYVRVALEIMYDRAARNFVLDMNETDFATREDELKDVIQNKAKVVQQSMQAIELAKGAQAEIDRVRNDMQAKLDMEQNRSLELEKTLGESNKKLWKVTDEYTRLAGKV